MDKVVSKFAFHPPKPATYRLGADGTTVVRADGLRFDEPFEFEFVEWRQDKRFANTQRLATFWFEYTKGYDGPVPPKQPSVVILFCHVNAVDCGSCLGRCHVLSQRLGVDVVCFDYPGYGLSSGAVSEAAATHSATGVYARVRERFPNHKLILYGQSIGSVPAIHLATKTFVDGLVLDGAITSAMDVVRKVPLYTTRHIQSESSFPAAAAPSPSFLHRFRRHPKRSDRHTFPGAPGAAGNPAQARALLVGARHTSRLDRLRNIDRVAHTLAPAVLVLHGAKDRMVAQAHAEAFVHLWEATQHTMVELVVLKDSGHCDAADRQYFEYYKCLGAFARGVARGKWANRRGADSVPALNLSAGQGETAGKRPFRLANLLRFTSPPTSASTSPTNLPPNPVSPNPILPPLSSRSSLPTPPSPSPLPPSPSPPHTGRSSSSLTPRPPGSPRPPRSPPARRRSSGQVACPVAPPDDEDVDAVVGHDDAEGVAQSVGSLLSQHRSASSSQGGSAVKPSAVTNRQRRSNASLGSSNGSGARSRSSLVPFAFPAHAPSFGTLSPSVSMLREGTREEGGHDEAGHGAGESDFERELAQLEQLVAPLGPARSAASFASVSIS